MIKGVKLFVNDNNKARKAAELIEEKLIYNGIMVLEDGFDLAIAIGGDGAFLRMIKETNFSSDIYYVGVNAGSLGFLQEVKLDEIDVFIKELKNREYKVEEIGIQETVVNRNKEASRFYSLNEIVVRAKNLKAVKLDISIDDNLLERFTGDGLLIATSSGSTAHNLSFGGSIVYNTFSSLQITPIGPINSKAYKSLISSIVIPDKRVITLIPSDGEADLIVSVDGENNVYDGVESVVTKIDRKKIKVLRLSHYSFAEKINEKLLSD